MKQLVAEYLSDNAEALRLLHQAASMKDCRYPIDLSRGGDTPFPHLNKLRQAARLLEIEAIQNVEEQKPQQAVESVVASMGVTRSLNQEPVLISYLVHVACQGLSVASLENVLNRTQLTDEQLGQLVTATAESEDHQILIRAFVGERCMVSDGFERIHSGKTRMSELYNFIGPLILVYRATGLLELDEISSLDMMNRYVNTTDLSPLESMAAARSISNAVASLPRLRFLSRAIVGSFDSVFSRASRGDATFRDAQTALAIERYRLANGRLPDQLSDLIPAFLPAVPADPFDGKPLRYKKLGKGYVVYSVGDDGVDNGGAEKNSKGLSYGDGTDITFTVER